MGTYKKNKNNNEEQRSSSACRQRARPRQRQHPGVTAAAEVEATPVTMVSTRLFFFFLFPVSYSLLSCSLFYFVNLVPLFGVLHCLSSSFLWSFSSSNRVRFSQSAINK